MISSPWIIIHIINRKILKACGLTNNLLDRRTFDRRLDKISTDIKERISTMGNRFVKEKLVDPYILSVDNTYVTESYGTCMAQIIHNRRSSTMFRYRY